MSTDDKNPQSGTDTNKKNKTPNAWGTNKKTEGGKENPNSGKPNKKFQGGTKGLEDDTFYYGPGMDNKFLHSKEKVINFIGKKYDQIELHRKSELSTFNVNHTIQNHGIERSNSNAALNAGIC